MNNPFDELKGHNLSNQMKYNQTPNQGQIKQNNFDSIGRQQLQTNYTQIAGDNDLKGILNPSNTQESFNRAPTIVTLPELPFTRDYQIVFHEQEPFKLSLTATDESMSIILFCLQTMKFWKGEFPARYLEDISRKTGREQTYRQFLELLNEALTSLDSNRDQTVLSKKKHIFIDLLGYEDLQLLKARKG